MRTTTRPWECVEALRSLEYVQPDDWMINKRPHNQTEARDFSLASRQADFGRLPADASAFSPRD
eukprot:4957946-Prymnesium_polylepis.1